MIVSKTLLYPFEFTVNIEGFDNVKYYIRNLDPQEGEEEQEIRLTSDAFDRLINLAQVESTRCIADALDPWREVPSGEYPPIASRIDDIARLLEHMLGAHDVGFGTPESKQEPS